MKSSSEMRREAWGVIRGKWFWRMLAVSVTLQAIASFANALVSQAFKVLSITEVGDYMVAKVNAARQGLAYSLPTMKAYCWMIGGFCFQMFIAYIFAAIVAFGFMGLLLKARDDADAKWFSDSFGGFARPLDVTWLLILMNLAVFLYMAPWLLLGGALSGAAVVLVKAAAMMRLIVVAIVVVSVCVSVLFAFRAVYAYRQSWFLKNEKPELSAARCMRLSREMMKGHKMQAFELDFSYLGWILLVVIMFGVSLPFAYFSARNLGLGVAVLSFCLGVAAFYLCMKVFFGMAASRAVFYRELQADIAAEGEA